MTTPKTPSGNAPDHPDKDGDGYMLEYGDKPAPMFEYEGVKYPFFVANRTGTIGSPVFHPADKVKQLGVIGADFMWTEAEPFLAHLDLNLRDERNVREDETIRKRANLVTQNSRLFTELVQGGYAIAIDDTGERSEPAPRDRAAMLKFQPEIQSQIIDDWLGNFHISRIVPAGQSDIDSILATPDTIHFLCKVGNFKQPTHVLLVDFNVPSPDARRSYENDTFIPGSKNEGERQVSTYFVDNKAKLRFAKKYFKGVSGAMLGKDGEVNHQIEDLRAIDPKDEIAVKEFTKAFNPNWWIRLADELAGCFSFSGK